MVKKIKKTQSNEPSENLLGFIQNDKKEQKLQRQQSIKDNKSTISKYKSSPSTRPRFIHWKKKNILEWDSLDFIGYYLSEYLKIFKQEDLDFKNRKEADTYFKERGYLERCLERLFDSNKEEFKNYIEWIIKWWIAEESFVDGYPSFWAVFKSEKATFVKNYLANKNTSKVKTRRIVKTRRQIDNDYASKDSWDEYFKERE